MEDCEPCSSDAQCLLTDASQIDGVLKLPSIDCTLALADVYEKIAFEND